MTDVRDTLLLRVEFEPGLADYRRRVLATVLSGYPGVVLVEVLDPQPVTRIERTGCPGRPDRQWAV